MSSEDTQILANIDTPFDLEEEMLLGRSGRKELACGSQAPIATLLFDPSMSALPIIVKHNSQRVGLFTR